MVGTDARDELIDDTSTPVSKPGVGGAELPGTSKGTSVMLSPTSCKDDCGIGLRGAGLDVITGSGSETGTAARFVELEGEPWTNVGVTFSVGLGAGMRWR